MEILSANFLVSPSEFEGEDERVLRKEIILLHKVGNSENCPKSCDIIYSYIAVPLFQV